MDSQILVRMDAELKEKVQRLAKAEGKSASQVIRGLILDYTRERDLAGYIDGLWHRIGSDMEQAGVKQKDIAAAIRGYRAETP